MQTINGLNEANKVITDIHDRKIFHDKVRKVIFS